jgi:hypothetical protein
VTAILRRELAHVVRRTSECVDPLRRCGCSPCQLERGEIAQDAPGYAALVARAVALLDDAVPGWRARVDAESLDVVSPNACVLGQLFGDYGTGYAFLTEFDARRYRAAKHAFSGFTPTTYWLAALEAS